MYSKPSQEQRSNKCFVFLLAAFVLLCAILLVFASIVLRVKKPLLHFESASVNNLSYRTSPSPSFKLTMVAKITVNNPNFGNLDYGNSSVTVLYGNSRIAERELEGGRVKAGEIKALNVTLNLRSDPVVSSGNLSNDILSGAFNLTGYTKLTGTVHLLKFLKKNKSTELACVLRLNLTSYSVQNLQC
ncbi:late embryogenesis abundant protein At1g64065 [Prosopis cineraria]|uniref:late embryogenesis abundant protein At1g64065 n=1 Tax=Prosopis cineraria TaxID=364024 RepID=UPI0024100802|nr:late embryogenesis abundant protein At1g64065 [Prosopis cineraria]